MIEGRLSTWKDASLPAIAAFGGMLLPALIYLAINNGDPVALRGWAIPAATDIAFALGVLALLGSRVPVALKIFLLALAILDDLGAIIIIAIFYTDSLSLASLAIGLVGAGMLAIFNLKGVTKIAPYILVGIVMWVCVLKSGVHATLAGVVVALMIPLKPDQPGGVSPLKKLEVSLHSWVAFGIMPLFAFANAGVSLEGLSLAELMSPIPLGISLGLFLGKQFGIFGFSWISVKLGICRLPDGVSWSYLYGVALLAGIGFTMSLFVGTLAFSDPEHAKAVRLGVLMGSFFSAVLGYMMLRWLWARDQRALAAGGVAPGPGA
jgi:NhaA family Na+:H+ antiporter